MEQLVMYVYTADIHINSVKHNIMAIIAVSLLKLSRSHPPLMLNMNITVDIQSKASSLIAMMLLKVHNHIVLTDECCSLLFPSSTPLYTLSLPLLPFSSPSPLLLPSHFSLSLLLPSSLPPLSLPLPLPSSPLPHPPSPSPPHAFTYYRRGIQSGLR